MVQVDASAIYVQSGFAQETGGLTVDPSAAAERR